MVSASNTKSRSVCQIAQIFVRPFHSNTLWLVNRYPVGWYADPTNRKPSSERSNRSMAAGQMSWIFSNVRKLWQETYASPGADISKCAGVGRLVGYSAISFVSRS